MNSLAKRLGDRIVHAIEFPDRLVFLFDVEKFRHGALHAKRQLVGLDACPHRVVVRILGRGQAVEIAEQLKLAFLLLPGHACGERGIGEGRLAADLERDRAVFGTKITAALRTHAAATTTGRLAQGNELRQVFIE